MRQQHQNMRKITPQYQQEYQPNDNDPLTEGGVEWEEFEIENIVNNEERTVVMHAAASVLRHENGYKEDSDKKKKKKSVFNSKMILKEVAMLFLPFINKNLNEL